MLRRSAFALILIASPAHAIGVETEASGSSDFFYARTHAGGDLGEHATLGGGLELVSDWRTARVGLEADAAGSTDHFGGGLSAGWAPRQEGRGWLWIEPHASGKLERERWSLDGELGVKLRRADVGLVRGTVAVDQLQLRFEGRARLGAWQLEVLALYSFYDPDLPRLGPAADTGLLITTGGKPERWAVAAAVSRALPRSVRLELGLGAVGYAAGNTVALQPRAALRAGPFKGVTPGVSLELVCPLDEPPHPIAGFALEYER